MRTATSQPTTRVLIIEDDSSICEFLRLLFTRDGKNVDVLNDGADALGRIRLLDPDVIILDLLLPKMNGFEIIRDLAARTPETLGRVIVVTAASDSTLKNFNENRIYGVIRKPFDIDLLMNAVSACSERTEKQH